MSEEPAPSPEKPEKSPAKKVTRVRRISNPRPRKTAKAKTAPVEEAAFPVFDESTQPAPAVEEKAAPVEKAPDIEVPVAEASADQASASEVREADDDSQGPAKRKRRRRKGKGNGSQNEETSDEESESARDGNDSAEAPRNSQPRQNQRQRPKADPELLAKFAWKIFLAEVSEEGVALVGDSDARELSRRCFRLAEIFLDEQARRS